MNSDDPFNLKFKILGVLFTFEIDTVYEVPSPCTTILSDIIPLD